MSGQEKKETGAGSTKKAGKGLFDQLADGLVSGLRDSAEAVAEGAQMVGHSVIDGAQMVGNAVAEGANMVGESVMDSAQFVGEIMTDSTRVLLDTFTKTGEVVVDQLNGTVGYIKNGVYYVGDKAVEGSVIVKDGVLSVGENIIGTLINTGKFLSDSEYRDKVGMPWLREVISSNQKILVYQMKQNQKSLGILYRYSLGEQLNKEELEIATKQLTAMAKLVPALAIFLLPGGMVLLPMLAKVLPWDLIPDLKPPEEGESAEGAPVAEATDKGKAPSGGGPASAPA